MKRNSLNSAKPSRKDLNVTAGSFLAGLVIISALSIAAAFTWGIVKKTDYFDIRDIVYRGDNAVDLSFLKGRSILALDLKKEALALQALLPAYKRIRLFRILPNRLFVDFLNRKPIACIKLYRYFCIDAEAVIFDIPAQLAAQDLPLVTGLNPALNNRYNTRELKTAVEIIQEAKKDVILKNFPIKKIDVSSITNASFFMAAAPLSPEAASTRTPTALEIKIGPDRIKSKINILGRLLGQLKFSTIKYIDLRFKEPVIKFNDA